MSATNVSTAEAINKGAGYFTTLQTGTHTAFADEPFEFGGLDKAPSPVDYLCMSLASCKAITIRMYAQRKTWPLTEISVNVKLVKATGTDTGKNTFFCEINLDGDLTVAQKSRLMEIGKSCPVQRLLCKASDVVSVLM